MQAQYQASYPAWLIGGGGGGAFVIRFLESSLCKLAAGEISIF